MCIFNTGGGTSMSVKEDVKLLLAKEAMTMKRLAELMKEKTGYTYNLKVISDKLARKSLKYEEFKIITDILGYDIELKKRQSPRNGNYIL